MRTRDAKDLPPDAVMGGVTTSLLVYPDALPVVLGEKHRRYKSAEGMTQEFMSDKKGRRASECGKTAIVKEKKMGLFSSFTTGEKRKRRSGKAKAKRSFKGLFGKKLHRARDTSSVAKLLGERKHRRAHRRVREYSPFTSFGGLFGGERKHRRARRIRRTREVRGFHGEFRPGPYKAYRKSVKKVAAKKARKVSRKVSRKSAAPLGLLGAAKATYAGERRRRRFFEPRFLGLAGLGEKRRRRHAKSKRRVGKRYFRDTRRPIMIMEKRARRHRRARDRGIFGNFLRELSPKTNGSNFVDIAKKAGWAAGGLIAGRVTANLLEMGLGKISFLDFATKSKYSGIFHSSLATIGIVWATKLKFMPAVVKSHRQLLALGSMLHVVEEGLAIILPALGIGPGTGVVKRALFGDSLGSLGYCSTGCGIPQSYLQNTSQQPCGLPGAPGTQLQYSQYPYAQPDSNMVALNPGLQGLGYCSTGPCAVPQCNLHNVSSVPCAAGDGISAQQMYGGRGGGGGGSYLPNTAVLVNPPVPNTAVLIDPRLSPPPPPAGKDPGTAQPTYRPTTQGEQPVVAPDGRTIATTAGTFTTGQAGIGLAGQIALSKAGDAANDPFIADLLVRSSGQAQQILDAAGIR